VERLLHELGAGLRRGEPPAAAPLRCATGLPDVDRLLGGGFPRGGLSEIAGAASCGRTSLALALLARTTAAGHWAAVVDASDAFDPGSAQAAGARLARVLWVRPPDPHAALRSAERVLAAHGFALVWLDLVAAGARAAPPAAAWTRLRRLAAGTQAALLVLASRRLAGSCADLAVELDARPRFGTGPDWLEGLEASVRVVRSRAGSDQGTVAVRLASRAA
jgi:RecA/RadA recombinase